MEPITDTEKIEEAQTELCRTLIDMMPVEWSSICFYAEYANKQLSFWFAVSEKKTGAVATIASFWKRYDSYPTAKSAAENDIFYRVLALYKAYLNRFGAEKIWQTYYLTINDDLRFHCDLGYDAPIPDPSEKNNAIFRKFFNADYKYLDEKYPY